jgi:hypothetical protein
MSLDAPPAAQSSAKELAATSVGNPTGLLKKSDLCWRLVGRFLVSSLSLIMHA